MFDVFTCAALSQRDATPGDTDSTRPAVSGGGEPLAAGVRDN